MTNVDLKQTLKHLYAPSAKEVSQVVVPPLAYLMLDGEGDPNTSARYVEAVQTLYQLAYAVRAVSQAAGRVFRVMPLEGLWTIRGAAAPPEGQALTAADKANFVWTLMILQPDWVTAAMVEQARAQAGRKKPVAPRLAEARLETYAEGPAVQIMHLGPYAEEGPTIARLHRYLADNGWRPSGRHHEIYLGDPRRGAPEKLKTIIRQPYQPAAQA